MGLAGFEGRHPRDLSSGERERLALAAVLVAEPDLLVLDEPTRGVDPERKDELTRLLRAQAPSRATLTPPPVPISRNDNPRAANPPCLRKESVQCELPPSPTRSPAASCTASVRQTSSVARCAARR